MFSLVISHGNAISRIEQGSGQVEAPVVGPAASKLYHSVFR